MQFNAPAAEEQPGNEEGQAADNPTFSGDFPFNVEIFSVIHVPFQNLSSNLDAMNITDTGDYTNLNCIFQLLHVNFVSITHIKK